LETKANSVHSDSGEAKIRSAMCLGLDMTWRLIESEMDRFSVN